MKPKAIKYLRPQPKVLGHHKLNQTLLTRKSTPIVALLSSSGSHCSSEKRSNRLDLPTEEFPMRRSFTLIGWFEAPVVGAMIQTVTKVLSLKICRPEVVEDTSRINNMRIGKIRA